jgi:hypothetical protein
MWRLNRHTPLAVRNHLVASICPQVVTHSSVSFLCKNTLLCMFHNHQCHVRRAWTGIRTAPTAPHEAVWLAVHTLTPLQIFGLFQIKLAMLLTLIGGVTEQVTTIMTSRVRRQLFLYGVDAMSRPLCSN